MDINEDNFITQLKLKNPAALDFIVNNYSNLVYKISCKILNSDFHSHYVGECANDVFWSLWNNISSFDDKKGNFKHWLSAISKYKALDYRRKLVKQSDVKCLNNEVLSDEYSIEDIIIASENKSELLEMIDTMKSEYREIFVRRYFLHEKIENIAKVLGISRNLVDKKLSRGRASLKAKLMFKKGEMLG